MTGLEWENFEKYDSKEYIVEKNTEFIKYYEEKVKEGYHPTLNLDEIQKLIDKLAMFFEFKYPEEMLDAFRYGGTEKKAFYECVKIAKKLDIEQLKYRLNYNELCFLECKYPLYVTLRSKSKKLYVSSFSRIRINSDGRIASSGLEDLEFDGFIKDTDGITRVEDLLGRFFGLETDVDYSELEHVVTNHKNSVAIRNKVLEMTMLKMLYSSLPEHGYIRAKRFMRMFNKEYNLDLTMEKLDSIMSIDYKDTNYVKQKIKERKKAS